MPSVIRSIYHRMIPQDIRDASERQDEQLREALALVREEAEEAERQRNRGRR